MDMSMKPYLIFMADFVANRAFFQCTFLRNKVDDPHLLFLNFGLSNWFSNSRCKMKTFSPWEGFRANVLKLFMSNKEAKLCNYQNTLLDLHELINQFSLFQYSSFHI